MGTNHRTARGGAVSGLLLAGVALAAVSGCTPQVAPGNPPQAPVVEAGEVNAIVVPPPFGSAAQDVIIFQSKNWQTNPRPTSRAQLRAWQETYRWGWRNDVLVQNPYAMQLRIRIRIGTDGFEVRDAAGNRVAFTMPHHRNSSRACTDANGQSTGGECWPNPGEPGYHQPDTVPDDQLHVTLEAVGACNGVPSPALSNTTLADRSTQCAAGQTADFASILTVSPAVPTGGMRVGEVVHLTLVSYQGSGAERVEATTPLTLVYLPPYACQVTARATPAAPQAKDSDVKIDWTVANCARAVASFAGQVLADERIVGVDPPYGSLSGQFQVKAPSPPASVRIHGIDLLGRAGGSYDLKIGSNPPTSPDTPPPAPCPGGAQEQNFSFTRSCYAGGMANTIPVGAIACSADEALQYLRRIYAMDGCTVQ